MKKLKDILNESYAWERKPGKPLPTLSEVQEEYQRNLQEETEYKVAGRPVKLNKNGSEDQTKWTVTFANGKTEQYSSVISLIKPRPKLQEPRWQDNDGDGKWYEKGDDVNEDFEGGYGGNKRRRWDDKPGYSRGEWDDTYKHKKQPDVEATWPKEWNELVDSVNQDPNIEASEEIDYRAAISRLKNIKTGEIWELIQPQQGDMYVMYRPEGRMSDYSVKTLEDLIASFKGVKQESVNLTENMRRFGTKNLKQSSINKRIINEQSESDPMNFWPDVDSPEPAATTTSTPPAAETPDAAATTNLQKVANLQDIKDGMKINFFDDKGQKKQWDSGIIVNAEQLKNPVNKTIVFEFKGNTMGPKVIAWSPQNANGEFHILKIPRLTTDMYKKLKVVGMFKRLFSDSIYNKDLAALMSKYMSTYTYDANAEFGGNANAAKTAETKPGAPTTDANAAAQPETTTNATAPEPSADTTNTETPAADAGAANTNTWLKYPTDNIYLYQLRGNEWFAKNAATNVEYNISKNPKYKAAIDRLNKSLESNELQVATNQ